MTKRSRQKPIAQPNRFWRAFQHEAHGALERYHVRNDVERQIAQFEGLPVIDLTDYLK